MTAAKAAGRSSSRSAESRIRHCRNLQQLFGVSQAGTHFVQGFDDLRQRRTLAAQRLSVFGFVPDVGVFQLAVDFGQAITFVIVVKDTPEWTGSARTGP